LSSDTAGDPTARRKGCTRPRRRVDKINSGSNASAVGSVL